jgi:hypothetical protein
VGDCVRARGLRPVLVGHDLCHLRQWSGRLPGRRGRLGRRAERPPRRRHGDVPGRQEGRRGAGFVGCEVDLGVRPPQRVRRPDQRACRIIEGLPRRAQRRARGPRVRVLRRPAAGAAADHVDLQPVHPGHRHDPGVMSNGDPHAQCGRIDRFTRPAGRR